MRRLNFRLFFILISMNAIARETYPYRFTYNGNPLVRNHGAADPDVHVWDGVVWMYTSQDRTMDPDIHPFHYAAMDGYHVFSSTDMIHWTDHGEIFHSSMMNKDLWGDVPPNWMWAPGAARKQDENGVWTYYLYYPKNVSFTGQTWVTGVATAPTPYGPFTDQGPLRGGVIAMDPMVFMDDDGEAYIYANNGVVARLKPDMMTLAEAPRKIEYAPQSIVNDVNLRFGEGAYMHKRNGIYYFSYSNFHNKTNQAFYAMGDSPYGPFEWKGPFSGNPRGAQDHHSVIEFQGQWYYFYHIAGVTGLPVRKEGQGRIASYDRLYYNPDGTMQMVVLTEGPKKILKLDVPHGYLKLDPPGGAYDAGTEVTLTVIGNPGYAFDSWSGDLSGSENPARIVMDADKTVKADFVEVPTYTLNVTATNGSIILYPAGGVYNEGTVVRVFPVNDFGYRFSHWSGGLAVTDNPRVVVMNSDQHLTAYYRSVPTYTLNTHAVNGIVELHPPGGLYEEGTVVTLTADRDFSHRFSEWSGDVSGTQMTATVVMNSDKEVTAAFKQADSRRVVFAVNSGGGAYRSSEGVHFTADLNVRGGNTFSDQSVIAGTDDGPLFHVYRFGEFAYDIPLPNGRYEVTLYFAETYFNAANRRVFDVTIEDKPVLQNLDVWKELGRNTALEKTFPVEVTDGKLNIAFSGTVNHATLSGIKIVKP